MTIPSTDQKIVGVLAPLCQRIAVAEKDLGLRCNLQSRFARHKRYLAGESQNSVFKLKLDFCAVQETGTMRIHSPKIAKQITYP